MIGPTILLFRNPPRNLNIKFLTTPNTHLGALVAAVLVCILGFGGPQPTNDGPNGLFITMYSNTAPSY